MSDGMGREFAYLSSHANNRYFIPNWGILGTGSFFDSSIFELSPNIEYGLWAETFIHVPKKRITIVIIFSASIEIAFLIIVTILI